MLIIVGLIVELIARCLKHMKDFSCLKLTELEFSGTLQRFIQRYE
jgi:hypothetical protein